MNPRRRFSIEKRHRQIQLPFGNPFLQIGLIAFAQCYFELGKLLLHGLQHHGKMIPQDNLRRADANVLGDSAANLLGDQLKVVEERSNKPVEIFALGSQSEGTSLKERGLEEVFQLNDLPAHGGLLDSVRHVADGLTDATVFGYIIEQLQMV